MVKIAAHCLKILKETYLCEFEEISLIASKKQLFFPRKLSRIHQNFIKTSSGNKINLNIKELIDLSFLKLQIMLSDIKVYLMLTKIKITLQTSGLFLFEIFFFLASFFLLFIIYWNLQKNSRMRELSVYAEVNNGWCVVEICIWNWKF